MKPTLIPNKKKVFIVKKRIVFEQNVRVEALTEQDALDAVWDSQGEEVGELQYYKDSDTDKWEVRKAYADEE